MLVSGLEQDLAGVRGRYDAPRFDDRLPCGGATGSPRGLRRVSMPCSAHTKAYLRDMLAALGLRHERSRAGANPVRRRMSRLPLQPVGRAASVKPVAPGSTAVPATPFSMSDAAMPRRYGMRFPAFCGESGRTRGSVCGERCHAELHANVIDRNRFLRVTESFSRPDSAIISDADRCWRNVRARLCRHPSPMGSHSSVPGFCW